MCFWTSPSTSATAAVHFSCYSSTTTGSRNTNYLHLIYISLLPLIRKNKYPFVCNLHFTKSFDSLILSTLGQHNPERLVGQPYPLSILRMRKLSQLGTMNQIAQGHADWNYWQRKDSNPGVLVQSQANALYSHL